MRHVVVGEEGFVPTLTPNEKRLLEAARALSAAARERDAETQRRIADFTWARLQTPREPKTSVLKKALHAAAGLGHGDLHARHAGEREALLRFQESERRIAVERSADVRADHERRVAVQIEAWERRLGARRSSARLVETATLIETSSYGGDPSPRRNTAHPVVEAAAGEDAGGGKHQIAFAEWYFLFTPPRGGVLTIVSALSLSGHGCLWVEPTGFEGGHATVQLTVEVAEYQIGGDAGLVEGPTTTFTPIAPRSVLRGWDEHVGRVDSFVLQSLTPITLPLPWPVAGDAPVVLRVAARFDSYAVNAQATVDLQSGCFGMNVPLVGFVLR